MKIDFKRRTIDGSKPHFNKRSDVTLQQCLDRIEELYNIYKYSTPSVDEPRRTYFYALPAEKLTDEQLVIGANRREAKDALELYVLEMICSGVLVWDEKRMGKWYWKGKDKDLVILRDWIKEECV